VEQERSAKLDQLARAIGICDTPATFAVAFDIEEQPHSASNGNAIGTNLNAVAAPGGHWLFRPRAPERIPWFEEAMAIDVRQRACAFAVTASTLPVTT